MNSRYKDPGYYMHITLCLMITLVWLAALPYSFFVFFFPVLFWCGFVREWHKPSV